MHAKGGGIFIIDSGKIVFSESGVVIHGPHDAFESDIGEVLCPVLTPWVSDRPDSPGLVNGVDGCGWGAA
jgi:hypothetical protein